MMITATMIRAALLVLVLLHSAVECIGDTDLLSFVQTYELTLDPAYHSIASGSIERPVNAIFIHAIL